MLKYINVYKAFLRKKVNVLVCLSTMSGGTSHIPYLSASVLWRGIASQKFLKEEIHFLGYLMYDFQHWPGRGDEGNLYVAAKNQTPVVQLVIS